MVKDIIIEEKNCFSDDSARRFMQTIQQMSCNISNPDLSLHSSPLFTHIEIHYTQYGKKKKRKKHGGLGK